MIQRAHAATLEENADANYRSNGKTPAATQEENADANYRSNGKTPAATLEENADTDDQSNVKNPAVNLTLAPLLFQRALALPIFQRALAQARVTVTAPPQLQEALPVMERSLLQLQHQECQLTPHSHQ